MIADRCATHKFEAQGKMFFQERKKLGSIEEANKSSVPEETFCLIVDKLSDTILLYGYFLCELLYFPEDEMISITAIRRKDSIINVDLSYQFKCKRDISLSVSLICTEDIIYRNFLSESIDHYRNILSGKYVFDFSVAYFGNDPPQDSSCNISKYPYENFHMAYARNLSLNACKGDIVLMVDLDCLLSEDQIISIIERFKITKHHGVFNIKKDYSTGNGLYLGDKILLQQNEYNEDFKNFWFEDTEFLMNFSRRGIVPQVHFVDFEHKTHSREKTLRDRPYYEDNKNLFGRILKYGR